MESFKVCNLTFTYPNQSIPALSSLSFDIEQGQFVNLCGPSGCGKSTLLRQLKPVLASHGEKSGEIYCEGEPLDTMNHYDQTAKIGFVMQNPDSQIVTDKVWHELAFGLESLGTDTETIRLRVAEMAAFFGIEGWFYSSVSQLSGGQKQLVNLASVMVMQPSVIILDEPTSQLDPIAAADFLATVGRINRELGITVIITEHRLEEVFPLADRVLVMEEGHIIFDGSPRQVGEHLKRTNHSMFLAMPTPMRVYADTNSSLPCPITIREGYNWLNAVAKDRELQDIPKLPAETDGKTVIELEDVWFRYEKNTPDVLRGLSYKVKEGKIYAILGGNGAGKSTALSVIAGLQKPYRGTVKTTGKKVGMLPQNPQTLFVKKTVDEDLKEVLQDKSAQVCDHMIEQVSELCNLTGLLGRHPYDLSGGEQQRAALAKILLLRPDILLLDEPTKGLDAEFKESFASILCDLTGCGITIIMVSHDVEFCACYGDNCALFFDGSIVSSGITRKFFTGNSFYTTAANRMARHLLPEAVTAADIILACGGKTARKQCKTDKKRTDLFTRTDTKEEEPIKKYPLWRRMFLWSGILCLLMTIVLAVVNVEGFMTFISGGSAAKQLPNKWLYGGICLGVGVAVCMIGVGSNDKSGEKMKSQPLSKRMLTTMLIVLFAIPMTILFGMYYLDDRRYYFIGLLVIIETMIPFILRFEDKKPQARELVVIAVLCAIAVAGRSAFYMIPQFKPIAAIIIISAVAFGGETGFLVGVVSVFVSNMFFGQSHMMPWQLFAFGAIGLIAGFLFNKGLLSKNRLSLCIYGGVAVFVIYGGIMNPVNILAYQAQPTAEMFIFSYLQGIPFDLVHAASTVIFLWFISKPLLEKLERIKTKYNLIG